MPYRLLLLNALEPFGGPKTEQFIRGEFHSAVNEPI
jgi:hypothetical protein